MGKRPSPPPGSFAQELDREMQRVLVRRQNAGDNDYRAIMLGTRPLLRASVAEDPEQSLLGNHNVVSGNRIDRCPATTNRALSGGTCPTFLEGDVHLAAVGARDLFHITLSRESISASSSREAARALISVAMLRPFFHHKVTRAGPAARARTHLNEYSWQRSN
jgi:hypothetical protein